MLLDTITQQIPRFERISTGVNFYHGDTLTQALGQSLTLLPLFISSSLNSSLHKHRPLQVPGSGLQLAEGPSLKFGTSWMRKQMTMNEERFDSRHHWFAKAMQGVQWNDLHHTWYQANKVKWSLISLEEGYERLYSYSTYQYVKKCIPMQCISCMAQCHGKSNM